MRKSKQVSEQLSTGGGALPDGWSYPSPVWVPHAGMRGWFGGGEYRSGGLVWVKAQPATDTDIETLKRTIGAWVHIDEDSLVGTASADYRTFYRRMSTGQKIRLR